MPALEYARSSTEAPPAQRARKVSRAKVLKFVERQFDLADADKDGALTPEELDRFLHLLVHPTRQSQDIP